MSVGREITRNKLASPGDRDLIRYTANDEFVIGSTSIVDGEYEGSSQATQGSLPIGESGSWSTLTDNAAEVSARPDRMAWDVKRSSLSGVSTSRHKGNVDLQVS